MLLYRPQELGGRDQTDRQQGLPGPRGSAGHAIGWDFDTGLLYVKSKLENTNTGFIIYDRMQAALNNGTYLITRPSLNSPSPTSPAVLADVSPALVNTPTSSVTLIDFKASRDLMALEGGPLGVALGAEARWEKADTPPVPFTDTALGRRPRLFGVQRQPEYPGDIRRSDRAGDQVARTRRAHCAMTTTRTSATRSTPKLGFKAKATDYLAFRGTYAEAFRAPGPAETGGSSFGFTTFGILSQGNPNIKPETAKSYTLGIVAEPVTGLSTTLDYWWIDRKNEIIQADPNSIIGNLPTTGAPGTRIAGAQPNTFIYYDVDGNLGTVTGFYQNANQTKTDGFDFELRYKTKSWRCDRHDVAAELDARPLVRAHRRGLAITGIRRHARPACAERGWRCAEGQGHVLADLRPGPVCGHRCDQLRRSDQDGRPQGRSDQTRDGDGTITNANTGVSYLDAGQYACGVFHPDGTIYNGCKLPSFTTFDLFAKWSATKNLDLNFSIQNLFDRKAPFDPYLAIPYGINYNQTWHQAGAVGRFFTIAAKYTFY